MTVDLQPFVTRLITSSRTFAEKDRAFDDAFKLWKIQHPEEAAIDDRKTPLPAWDRDVDPACLARIEAERDLHAAAKSLNYACMRNVTLGGGQRCIVCCASSPKAIVELIADVAALGVEHVFGRLCVDHSLAVVGLMSATSSARN